MVSSTTVSSDTKNSIKINNANREKKSTSSSKNSGGGTGSRRIFSPLFKLQVLDSYRNDADCRGNQRATARKYGIHRRQIQKWLQMETNLCLSVQQSGLSGVTALNLSNVARPGGVAVANKRSCGGGGGGGGSGGDDNIKIQQQPLLKQRTVIVLPLSSESDTNTKDESSSSSSSSAISVTSDSDEYVNVDEITDFEYDDEMSSCSWTCEKRSLPNNDSAAAAPLDLRCTTATALAKRRFFSSEFKRNVLNAFNNDDTCKGNQRATARKFGIHRRQVQKWLNRIDLIESAAVPAAAERNEIIIGSGDATDDGGNVCLDLSQPKRKFMLERRCSEEPEIKRKSPSISPPQLFQESALCLVKKMSQPEIPDIKYPTRFASPVEHSFVSSPPNYQQQHHHHHHRVPEYSFGFYQPWSCCYATPMPVVRPECITIPKYSYTLDLKYETSYADIPVQYGFGDSVPSKWLKENPFFVHEPTSIRVLSSYK